MQLEKINFIDKRGLYNRKDENIKGVVGSSIINGNTPAIQFMFYNVWGNDVHHIKVGYVDDRCYFIVSNDPEDYKLVKIHKHGGTCKIVLSGKRGEPFKKFTRIKAYEFMYDEECNGYYIEL